MQADRERCGVVVLAAEHRRARGEAFARELGRRGHRVALVSPRLVPGATAWREAELSEGVPWRQEEERPDGVASRGGVHRVALPSDSAERADAPWSGADLTRALAALGALVDGLGLRCPVLLVQCAGWAHLARAAGRLTDFPLVCDLTVAQAGQAPGLLDHAALILAPSGPAAEVLRNRHWNVTAVPDGCDPERWEDPAGGPVLRPPLPGPLIGYAGDGPVDARLLVALAELRPEWTFPILARPGDAELELLDQLGNVYVLPNVAPAELPRCLAEFDVALAPLATTAPALERFPAEVLEALAAGKPVVATLHPDLLPLQQEGVAVGATPLELDSAIEHALAGTHDAEAGRVAARAAAWSERVERFAYALEALLPSLDVVVVSYGNAGALARCLRSIERDGSHPAQVIVVDNGSGPETQEVLDRAEKRGAVVERLPENLGFPAGVNRGLARGHGRYVLILNDDVQLPAGGLLALVHALSRSRATGLVGPVTNRITNEARVAVSYEERHPPYRVVDAVHAARAAEHAGAAVDVRVAALFAAIARREHLEAVGGLSERYQLGQFDDDDLSHRMRETLGLRVVYHDDIFVHHAGTSSFGALDAALVDGLFSRNRRVFERATQSTWQPHVLRDEQRNPHEPPAPMEETVNQVSEQDAELRVAELEAELSATRRDYQDKIAELARRAGAAGGAPAGADTGVYEMLLRIERERQELHNGLHAEHHERLRVEAERDALDARLGELTAERDRLRAELTDAMGWAAVLEQRARVLEASLAWKLGRAILDGLKRVPGMRAVARIAGRGR